MHFMEDQYLINTVEEIVQNSEFNQKWLKFFGPTLTTEQKEFAGIGKDDGFLWHAFSYGYIDCLKDDEARKAFDFADKHGAIKASYKAVRAKDSSIVYSISCDGLLSKDYMTSAQVDSSDDIEVYIIGKDYKWCYIRTHESNFWPYFCKSK